MPKFKGGPVPPDRGRDTYQMALEHLAQHEQLEHRVVELEGALMKVRARLVRLEMRVGSRGEGDGC